jgi:XTP/dITP diphosphohydrolase
MKVRFLLGNRYKAQEMQKILAPVGVEVIPVNRKIKGTQTDDIERLVRDKPTKTFEFFGRPLFVEHTVAYLEGMNGLPAGLTQTSRDKLEADRFVVLVRGLTNAAVTAKSVLGCCDGRQIHLFEGALTGKEADTPLESCNFQWDCVFVPDGYSEGFAEMGDRKNEISMRRKTLEKFAAFLSTGKGTA